MADAPGCARGAVLENAIDRSVADPPMRLAAIGLASVAAVLLFGSGCHRRPRTVPMPFERTYCWWSSEYVPVAPVWVASRFAESLRAAGFSHVEAERNADSAWVLAGPAAVAGGPSGTQYSFRVIAHPASDSVACTWRGTPDAPIARRPVGAVSCFHTDVSMYAPVRGWNTADTAAAGSRLLPLCGQIYRGALAGLERSR